MAIAEVELDETALSELEGSFGGQLVRPQDPMYDEHRRIWNGSIDRRPALIAGCAGVADGGAASDGNPFGPAEATAAVDRLKRAGSTPRSTTS